jgi:hypothetical protein
MVRCLDTMCCMSAVGGVRAVPMRTLVPRGDLHRLLCRQSSLQPAWMPLWIQNATLPVQIITLCSDDRRPGFNFYLLHFY